MFNNKIASYDILGSIYTRIATAHGMEYPLATRKKKQAQRPGLRQKQPPPAIESEANSEAFRPPFAPAMSALEEALNDINDPNYRQAWEIVYIDDYFDFPEIVIFEDAFVEFTKRHSGIEISNAVRALVETHQPRAVYAALLDKLKIIETARSASDHKAVVLRGRQPKKASTRNGAILSAQFNAMDRICSLVLNRAHKFSFWILEPNLEEISRLGIDCQKLLAAINSSTVYFDGAASQEISKSIRALDFAVRGDIVVSARQDVVSRKSSGPQEITLSKLYDVVNGRPAGKEVQKRKSAVTARWWNRLFRAGIKPKSRGHYELETVVNCLRESLDLSPQDIKTIEQVYPN